MRSKKLILPLVLGVAIAVSVGLAIGTRIRRIVLPTLQEQIADSMREMLTESHEIESANQTGWESLELGMTQDQVAQLIGKSQYVSSETNPNGSKTETWQYGHSDGMIVEFARGPSAEAYLVTFNADGQLISFASPH